MCQVTSAPSKSMSSKPAFQGASFDKNGSCVHHPTVQLAQQVKQDGKLLWKEIKMNCPKCCSANHKSRRVTSLGGKGVVKRGHGVHGMPPPLRKSNSGRHMDVEYDTPFDESGKCHHHPNVQMATKKGECIHWLCGLITFLNVFWIILCSMFDNLCSSHTSSSHHNTFV